MGDFRVSLNGGVEVTLNESGISEDITALLEFDENQIEDLLQCHAALQAFWEALAIRHSTRYEDFKEDWVKKWWAHNKMFSKYVLAAYGDAKPTLEAVKDTTILIYSQDTTEHERVKYAALAYTVASKNKIFFDGTEEDFRNSMYKHLLSEVPWHYESVIRTLHKFKEDADMVKNVAEKLNSRSYHMNHLQELMLAKQANMGPRSPQQLPQIPSPQERT